MALRKPKYQKPKPFVRVLGSKRKVSASGRAVSNVKSSVIVQHLTMFDNELSDLAKVIMPAIRSKDKSKSTEIFQRLLRLEKRLKVFIRSWSKVVKEASSEDDPDGLRDTVRTHVVAMKVMFADIRERLLKMLKTGYKRVNAIKIVHKINRAKKMLKDIKIGWEELVREDAPIDTDIREKIRYVREGNILELRRPSLDRSPGKSRKRKTKRRRSAPILFKKVRKADWFKEPAMTGHIWAKETVENIEEVVSKFAKTPLQKKLASYSVDFDKDDWHYFSQITKKYMSLLRYALRRVDAKKDMSLLLTDVTDKSGVLKSDLVRALEVLAYKYSKEQYVKQYQSDTRFYGLSPDEAKERLARHIASLRSEWGIKF